MGLERTGIAGNTTATIDKDLANGSAAHVSLTLFGALCVEPQLRE